MMSPTISAVERELARGAASDHVSQTANLSALRSEFPMITGRFHGRPLVYLDSAATTLKPQCVIDEIVAYYSQYTANVHRGNHLLSEEADERFEKARLQVARLVGAAPEQLIWTAGSTDGINQVAAMLGLTDTDEVIVSAMEHHSNLLPFRRAARTHTVRLTEDGRIDREHFEQLLTCRPRLVALSHVSNVLGVVQDLRPLLEMARQAGALTLVDGAQSAPRMPLDVAELGCDFFVFSAHKMLGPTGIGALYISDRHLEQLEPARLGGGMVASVEEASHQWAEPPLRFEAGTPHIAGAIGFGAAAEFLRRRAPLAEIYQHEKQLTERMVDGLRSIGRVRLWPDIASDRVGIVSFTVQGLDSDELATMLCHRANIMCRSGVHCAEPLARRLGVKSLVRASLYLYNTEEDVNLLVETVDAVVKHL